MMSSPPSPMNSSKPPPPMKTSLPSPGRCRAGRSCRRARRPGCRARSSRRLRCRASGTLTLAPRMKSLPGRRRLRNVLAGDDEVAARPPRIRLTPLPPWMTSLPSSPLMTSSPPRSVMMSSPAPPRIGRCRRRLRAGRCRRRHRACRRRCWRSGCRCRRCRRGRRGRRRCTAGSSCRSPASRVVADDQRRSSVADDRMPSIPSASVIGVGSCPDPPDRARSPVNCRVWSTSRMKAGVENTSRRQVRRVGVQHHSLANELFSSSVRKLSPASAGQVVEAVAVLQRPRAASRTRS